MIRVAAAGEPVPGQPYAFHAVERPVDWDYLATGQVRHVGMSITPKQARVLDFIRTQLALGLPFPTYQRIADRLGMFGPGNAHAMVRKLRERGHLPPQFRGDGRREGGAVGACPPVSITAPSRDTHGSPAGRGRDELRMRNHVSGVAR